MNKIGLVALLALLGIGCGEARRSDLAVTESTSSLTLTWDGWLDGSGLPATVVADATAPSGGPVQQIDRTASGGDYFSSWQAVVPGQSYCVRAAVKWVGGGVPFIGIQPSTSENPVWLMGAEGYSDLFGPVVAFSATEPGWQQGQYTVVMPEGATQARLVDELFSGTRKDGADLASIDAPSIDNGACGSAVYSQSFESGAGGWADGTGEAPAWTSDSSSPSGPGVISVTRATSGGDYFSPWTMVSGGQSYCVSAAVKWGGTGAAPFIGLQPSTNSGPVWLVGAEGYADAFGPVQVVNASGWQQFQKTVTMPAGTTQARFSIELFSGATLAGTDGAYFDGFTIASGACVGGNLYSERFETGAGGWADGTGSAPGLASDSSSPSGPGVISVTRAASGGDYTSPWTAVSGGQSYCVSAAVKWGGTGATPFIGLQPSTSPSGPVWLVGAEGYTDAFGPVQVVNASGWQQFQKTVTMPTGTTQARFAIELFSGATVAGSHGAYFDGFTIAAGACRNAPPYVQNWESGTGGWMDGTGSAPNLASDGSSPAGSAVMSLSRAATGGDYFSPWVDVTGGATYCVKTATKWMGGGSPFMAVQPLNGLPIWIVGSSGYVDAFGPVQAVSPTSLEWQSFQVTVTVSAGTTQIRLVTELYAGASKGGADSAYFDGFAIENGACGAQACNGSPVNACGGCATLERLPGTACGSCGVIACDGTDAVTCAPVEGVCASNASCSGDTTTRQCTCPQGFVGDGTNYCAVDLEAPCRLHGLGFSPYIDNQNPNNNVTVTAQQIYDRLALIADSTEWVRVYGCGNGLEHTGRLAHQMGLKVALGAWIGTDTATNTAQVQCLIDRALAGEVDVAVVGNEVLLRNDRTEAQLIAYIQQVKAAIPASIPVSTGEIASIWLAHPNLVAAVDTLYAHFYPFWEQRDVTLSVSSIHSTYQDLLAVSGGRPIVVGETGWPSAGSPNGAAVPSSANAERFLRNFVSWAEAVGVDYMYFEALDEPWKTVEGDFGDDWGCFDRNGALKPSTAPTLACQRMADNWSGAGRIPDETTPGNPTLQLTVVPPIGSTANLEGQANFLVPDDFRVAVYIKVGNWWTKPYAAQPYTHLRPDGSFTVDITTGGYDTQATEIAAFLIPKTYAAPVLLGASSIPAEVGNNAAASVLVAR